MITKNDIKRIILSHWQHDDEENAPFSYQRVAEDDLGQINTEGKGNLVFQPPPKHLIAPCVYCSSDIDVTEKIPELVEQFNNQIAHGMEADSTRKHFRIKCENDHDFELGIEIQIW